jgi:hypothetical protein
MMEPILPLLLAHLLDLLGICLAVGINVPNAVLFRIVDQILVGLHREPAPPIQVIASPGSRAQIRMICH